MPNISPWDCHYTEQEITPSNKTSPMKHDIAHSQGYSPSNPWYFRTNHQHLPVPLRSQHLPDSSLQKTPGGNTDARPRAPQICNSAHAVDKDASWKHQMPRPAHRQVASRFSSRPHWIHHMQKSRQGSRTSIHFDGRTSINIMGSWIVKYRPC